MALPLHLAWPCCKEGVARVLLRASSTLRLIFLFSYVLSIVLPKLYPYIFRSTGYRDYNEYEEDAEAAGVDLDYNVYEEVVEDEEATGVDFDYNEYEAEAAGVDLDYREEIAQNFGYEYKSSSYSEDSGGDEYNSSNSYNHHVLGSEKEFQNPYHSETSGEEEDDLGNREEEEEVVVVEDITGREDSYLDEMEFFDEVNNLAETNSGNQRVVAVVEDEISNLTQSNQRVVDEDHQRVPSMNPCSISSRANSIEIHNPVIWEIGPASDEEVENLYVSCEQPEEKTEEKMKSEKEEDHHHHHHHHHQLEAKEEKKVEDEDEDEEVMFSDSNGSTSKSSSEWRSSLHSCTEDPFSSSSRRSCTKWESYTLFQKYEEEMMFLDTITSQKLHETESLRRLIPRTKRQVTQKKKPYYELEAAYVAQVCLAWEALSWDYVNFKRKLVNRKVEGCPDVIAQQFQQFQVLLQRYIENEPYEYGKRPEIYARMRNVYPKLLQVPQYQDYYDDQQQDQVIHERIPTDTFKAILEDSILTFMNFLKADRENRYKAILSSMFRRYQTRNIELEMIKKTNKKKKLKLKQVIRRSSSCCYCIASHRKVTREQGMEAFMGLIDLNLVNRVLNAHILTQDQLRWCEAKMAKVCLTDTVHRDSTPLFYPTH